MGTIDNELSLQELEAESSHALRSSQRLNEIALESGALGSWSLDVATRRTVRSLRHDQIFGFDTPIEEWTYDNFISFVDPRDREHVDAAYRRALELGMDWEFECRIIRRDGEERWIWVKGKHFRDRSGATVEIIGLVSDITERKQNELAMRQNEKLAAVGRLASTIAHEMNNPLEAVTNLLYLARHSEDRDETRLYLSHAETELRRVAAIANQTLRFQRAVPVAARVSASELIASAYQIFKGRLTNHNIEVVERHRTEETILCFDGEIRQVLNNFISNAIDAMRPGGTLYLRSRAVNPAHGLRGVLITVADTGEGISPASARKIYDPFFSTKGASGSGLGLWVSREIIHRHHGRLTMRSSQDPGHHGTIFRLFLPVDLPPDQQITQ